MEGRRPDAPLAVAEKPQTLKTDYKHNDMKKLVSYYSEDIKKFLDQSNQEILGIIQSNNISHAVTSNHIYAWELEIEILKEQLNTLKEGRIIFEYIIPRMGKRVDTILIYKNIIFILEFKCGDTYYKNSSIDQVYDYALDLRNFQKESHNKLIVPIVVSTHAEDKNIKIQENNKIISPICCNSSNIKNAINVISSHFIEKNFNYIEWENSEYFPTPTIIEAAQALYYGHHVTEITRSDAGAKNLTITTDEINKIINFSKEKHKKSICFITGVPGAGKTLIGLNIAIQRSNARQGEHAVYLSGNFPLVTVLQEALARDKVKQEKNYGRYLSKSDALRSASSFIQIIHKYRDSFVENNNIPPEHITIFDEAQRAWTHDMIQKFMSSKKGILYFPYSEPEFLISTMDRHQDWAVILCLVGGGQEINTGEAGLPEWFDALRRRFPHWNIYISSHISDDEYMYGRSWNDIISNLNISKKENLHLNTSIRSFRSPYLSDFIKYILDIKINEARHLYQFYIKNNYPIVLTRDLNHAKDWIKNQCQGTTRCGLLASSGGLRLKADGIFVKNAISIENWFLNDKYDVRSSYMLEDVVTEFDIQGLELDYALIAWDADYRFYNGKWEYYTFKGSKWNNIHSIEKRRYLKNAYRVLLTRARQGLVIFIPKGNNNDITRKQEYYDGTFNYLKYLGIPEL